MVNPRLLQQHRQYAHELLVFFVKEGYNLYGQTFLIYNVHMMLHLSHNVSNFSSLDSCSAFAFENYMQVLKKHVRSGKNPIVQIVKRLLETQNNPVCIKKNQFSCKRIRTVAWKLPGLQRSFKLVNCSQVGLTHFDHRE